MSVVRDSLESLKRVPFTPHSFINVGGGGRVCVHVCVGKMQGLLTVLVVLMEVLVLLMEALMVVVVASHYYN